MACHPGTQHRSNDGRVERGADVGLRWNGATTPLHHAAQEGALAAVDRLLAAGASTWDENGNHHSVLAALRAGHEAVVWHMLNRYPGKPLEVSPNQWWDLFPIATRTAPSLAQALLVAGVPWYPMDLHDEDTWTVSTPVNPAAQGNWSRAVPGLSDLS